LPVLEAFAHRRPSGLNPKQDRLSEMLTRFANLVNISLKRS
jgi:hypothetical protein